MDCSLLGFSIHGILQARILEWVAIFFARGFSQPRNWTRSPALQEDSLPTELQGKPLVLRSGFRRTWKMNSQRLWTRRVWCIDEKLGRILRGRTSWFTEWVILLEIKINLLFNTMLDISKLKYGFHSSEKRSVFILIPKKGNAKECSNYRTIAFILYASKVMLKILQVKLQQHMNCEFPDVQTGFTKGRGTRDQIANMCWIIEKAGVPEKHLLLLYWLHQSLWLCESQ